MMERLNYWRRIFKVYLTKTQSYLNFWHERPVASENIKPRKLGFYYMTFFDKAHYAGPKDNDGVILFDYHSNIGRQYNPVAVAQYGLGNFNLYLETGGRRYLDIAKIQGEWLANKLEPNDKGIRVWQHHFKWHYKKVLPSGWYSALAQGNGISLLARLYETTKDEKYLEAAKVAFRPMLIEMEDGGVKYTDRDGNVWVEEYMVYPPTHILNGFIWAMWGIWDYYLLTKDEKALNLWNACVKTLKENLPRYDIGFWSLYDLSKQLLKMIASHFYHSLHVAQLRATFALTKDPIFESYYKRWDVYQKNKLYRFISLIYKAIFKLFYF